MRFSIVKAFFVQKGLLHTLPVAHSVLYRIPRQTLTYKINRITFAFRSSIQKEFEDVLGKKYYKDSQLYLNVIFTHKNDYREIQKVKMFKDVEHWGKRTFLKVLYSFSDEDLKALFSIPPTIPDESVILSKTQVEHSTIYLIGRFVKFAKQLPITKMDTPDATYCLQALLESFIADKFKTSVSNVTFHTSAVPLSEYTVLGLGKPFVCKIIGSKLSKLNSFEAVAMEIECNKLHARNGFAVRDFNIGYKDQLDTLKHHALVSQKHCVILCSIQHAEFLEETINTLNELQVPIVISQLQQHGEKRLLTKFVKKIVASRVQGNDVSFFLEILGSPGLHITNFLANKTTPSLDQLAKTQLIVHRVDIFEDCEQWPPVITPNVESFRARYQVPFYMCDNNYTKAYFNKGSYLQDVVIYKQQFKGIESSYSEEENSVSYKQSISHTNYEYFVSVLKDSILAELKMLGYLTDE